MTVWLVVKQSCNEDLRRFFPDNDPSVKDSYQATGDLALPSIIDSLASPPPQGNIPPIKTKCLMYVNADL